jgi:hypothetical protein
MEVIPRTWSKWNLLFYIMHRLFLLSEILQKSAENVTSFSYVLITKNFVRLFGVKCQDSLKFIQKIRLRAKLSLKKDILSRSIWLPALFPTSRHVRTRSEALPSKWHTIGTVGTAAAPRGFPSTYTQCPDLRCDQFLTLIHLQGKMST